MLIDMKITEFLDTLASDAPAPGGGSAAALSGAIASGLISMVCRLTIGKKGYEDVEESIKAHLEKNAFRLAGGRHIPILIATYGFANR